MLYNEYVYKPLERKYIMEPLAWFLLAVATFVVIFGLFVKKFGR